MEKQKFMNSHYRKREGIKTIKRKLILPNTQNIEQEESKKPEKVISNQMNLLWISILNI